MGLGTIAALEALLGRPAMLAGALLCSATDANGAGDRFAERHQALAEQFAIRFERLRPPIERRDWNDALCAIGSDGIGTMSTLTLAATNINPAPQNLGCSSSPPPAPLRSSQFRPGMPGQATIQSAACTQTVRLAGAS
jgi:hypothetical protein